MSFWTQVTGTVLVCSVGRTQPEMEYILKTVLEHLPKITGSENDVSIYINQVNGVSSSSNCDEFLNHSNLGNGRRNSFATQDRYLITLQGNLRDRMYEQTLRETSKWLHRLGTRLHILNCLVEVKGYGDERKVFLNENQHFSNLYYLYEEKWWDYLRWEHVRDAEGNLLGGKPNSFNEKNALLFNATSEDGEEYVYSFKTLKEFFDFYENEKTKEEITNIQNIRAMFFGNENTRKQFTNEKKLIAFCKKLEKQMSDK